MYNTLLKYNFMKNISPTFLGSALSDGQWHSVELISRRGRLTISVDKEEGGVAHASFSVSLGSKLFFGGKNTILKSFISLLKV